MPYVPTLKDPTSVAVLEVTKVMEKTVQVILQFEYSMAC